MTYYDTKGVKVKPAVHRLLCQAIATEWARHPNLPRPSMSDVIGSGMEVLLNAYKRAGVPIVDPVKVPRGRRRRPRLHDDP